MREHGNTHSAAENVNFKSVLFKEKNKFKILISYFKEKFYLERPSLFHYITTFKTFLGHLAWNGLLFQKHILLNCLSDLVVENICILLIDLIFIYLSLRYKVHLSDRSSNILIRLEDSLALTSEFRAAGSEQRGVTSEFPEWAIALRSAKRWSWAGHVDWHLNWDHEAWGGERCEGSGGRDSIIKVLRASGVILQMGCFNHRKGKVCWYRCSVGWLKEKLAIVMHRSSSQGLHCKRMVIGYNHPAIQVLENTLFPFSVFSSNSISNDYAPLKKRGQGLYLRHFLRQVIRTGWCWNLSHKALTSYFLPPDVRLLPDDAALCSSWYGHLCHQMSAD